MGILIFQIILFVLMSVLVLIMPLGLPSNFVISALALIYYLITKDAYSVWLIVLFFGLSALGELLENILGSWGAKKYGSSKAGMWGAFAGGILGAVLGGMVIPVIGSFIGVFVGVFACTLLIEVLISRKNLKEGSRAGWGALLGKVGAVTLKLAVGLSMLIITANRFWM